MGKTDQKLPDAGMLAKPYREAKPFPHVVVDNLLPEEWAERAALSFPQPDDKLWIHYIHYNEHKYGMNRADKMPEPIREVIAYFQSGAFVQWLEELTGIQNLLPDKMLEGGGMHQTKRRGFLNIHADFTVHPRKPKWQRRVNLIYYLNKDWTSNWGGNLELWDQTMLNKEVSVSPLFNRAVIFSTSETSYHGHPVPLNCPPDNSRKSLALYYYTEESAPRLISTNYKARPEDGSKKYLIWLDKQLIGIYTYLKRRTGFSDEKISRILAKLFGEK